MKNLIILLILSWSISMEKNIVDFQSEYEIEQWQIVNDGVMGGLSKSSVKINDDGYMLFTGQVSLENNGGFASVQHSTLIEDIEEYTHVKVRLKGDQKNYQLRLKSEKSQYQSYIQEFETSGDWEEITLKIADFYPSFRGRKLDMPNFEFNQIQQITFLIANKKAEEFALEVDQIDLIKK